MLGLLVVVYLALRMLVNSRFGNVLVAMRENPERATMLGYDIRRYQLGAFVIGSALAGLSGVLYTAWGQYITPSSMGITAAALPIVWVAVGGRSDLTATLVGTLVCSGRLSGADDLRQPVRARCHGGAAGGHRAACAGRRDHRSRSVLRAVWPAQRWRAVMALLETQALHKHFGGLHVTNDVNLALEEGEIHCLIGPNGAGKSTLFRLMLGEYTPSGGRILYAGKDITQLASA